MKPAAVPIHISPRRPSINAVTGTVKSSSPGTGLKPPAVFKKTPPCQVPTQRLLRLSSRTDHTKRFDNPLVESKWDHCPLKNSYKPAPSVPAQISPRLPRVTESTNRPCQSSGGLNIVAFLARKTHNPPPLV